MIETLAEKRRTPCRPGVPPLTRDEAQRWGPKLMVQMMLRKIDG
jgi:hypothetical protein